MVHPQGEAEQVVEEVAEDAVVLSTTCRKLLILGNLFSTKKDEGMNIRVLF